MIVEFLEVTFSRHGTCKLLYDTSLALARSSPTRRYTGLQKPSKRQRAQTEKNAENCFDKSLSRVEMLGFC